MRARTIDRIRRPYINPLYWKWMWSIMRSPGDRRIERLAIWARCALLGDTDLMNLANAIVSLHLTRNRNYIYRFKA